LMVSAGYICTQTQYNGHIAQLQTTRTFYVYRSRLYLQLLNLYTFLPRDFALRGEKYLCIRVTPTNKMR
jgi:hypothetical protein